MPHRTQITKRLEWLRPYLELAWPYIPRGKRITRVMAVRASVDKNQGFFGQLSTSDSRNYHMSLYTHYFSHTWWPEYRRSRKRKAFSKLDILQYFAHEIAHTAHWLHTPDHKILENQIANIFLKQLKKEGYVSEEDELKGRGPEPDTISGHQDSRAKC